MIATSREMQDAGKWKIAEDDFAARRFLIDERERSRTQEFVLRWSESISEPLREICRQQWNFSPPNSTREVEDYSVNLRKVTVLQLWIKPDIGGGNACARLRQLRVA